MAFFGLDTPARRRHIAYGPSVRLLPEMIEMISEDPERLFDPLGGRPKPHVSTDTRETYEQRLSHILEAATHTIARAGYEKASMRAVAKATGVSLAGLYHYFDSKEKMLFLIQFRTFSSLLNNLKEKLVDVTEPVEQLRVLIRAHVAYFAANMAALKVCSHELDSLNGSSYEETKLIRRDYYELSRAIIDRVMAEQAPDSQLDHHVATMSLFGTLNWLYRWYDPKRGPSAAAVASQITNQFLHGLFRANKNGKPVDA